MLEPFIGEISMFAGNFAPRGWAFCRGQLLPISQNSALYAILGTTYGGDGVTSFALPNLQGRSPVGTGASQSLSTVNTGQVGGVENVTIHTSQMPMHTHKANATGSSELTVASTGSNASATPSATNNILGASVVGGPPSAAIWSDKLTAPVTLANPLNVNVAVQPTGDGQAISIRNPYLGVNFIIALEGMFPSRD